MPLWWWGLAAGALLGVGVGLVIPDVLVAVGGAVLFAPLGALLGRLIALALRTRRR